MVAWICGAMLWKVQDRLGGDLARMDEAGRDALVKRYFQLAREEEDLRAKALQSRAKLAPAAELQALEAQIVSKRADKLALEHQAEAILSERVEHAAQSAGLAQDLPLNPQIVFPPVAFKYVEPPLLLVMSPHEKIEQKKTVHLQSSLVLSQIEQAEAAADQLGVVSLVVPIGGVGTYPTMVLATSSYEVSVDIVSHEWTHNYLDIRPLGWHYGDNGNLISINETVANIVGHELSLRVQGLPPPSYDDLPPATFNREPSPPGTFDFNREMRLTRLQVDDLLKEGKVQEAETYMEARRREFVAHGYALRKLNQAYFAFYGSYADGGVGTVNPIGRELKQLRRMSGSLKEFLDTVARLSTFDEYLALLKEKGVEPGKRG
ncbi:MAG: hypothetical protein HYR71_13800 [Chloroflexi bacterium]|nr:hypothetical protein [Chloroflexota bacterium]